MLRWDKSVLLLWLEWSCFDLHKLMAWNIICVNLLLVPERSLEDADDFNKRSNSNLELSSRTCCCLAAHLAAVSPLHLSPCHWNFIATAGITLVPYPAMLIVALNFILLSSGNNSWQQLTHWILNIDACLALESSKTTFSINYLERWWVFECACCNLAKEQKQNCQK